MAFCALSCEEGRQGIVLLLKVKWEALGWMDVTKYGII